MICCFSQHLPHFWNQEMLLWKMTSLQMWWNCIFNRGKIIDHRAKCIAPLSLRVGQRYKHFGTSPWAAWAGERSLVPDLRQTSPRLALNLPARGETRVLRVAKFCSIKLLYGDLYFVYVFGHLFKLKWNF